MKRRLSNILTVILSACFLASCNQEVIQENSYGYLGVRMDSDLAEDVIVKADAAPEELIFAIDVQNASGVSVASAEDHRTVTSENPFVLQIGYYDVIASHGEKANAAFNSPYYEGKKNVRIYPDKINTVDLTCTLANTAFSVEFPSEFAEHFVSYEVEVTNGTGDKLVLSNAPQAGNPLEAGFDAKAYFAVTGSLTWDLYLKNTDGSEYRTTVTYSDVKARQHYHLTFELGEELSEDGAFVVKVVLDNSMDESSHELILDFDNRFLPSFAAEAGFDAVSGVPMSVPFGNSTSKVMTISTPAGLQSFRITHSDEGLASAGLPAVSEFVGTSTDLSSVGIVVSQVMSKAVAPGAAGLTLDLTGFVSGLQVGMYSMTLTATDTKGHYAVFDLMIEIISDVDAEAVAAYAGWAAFAKLEGRYFAAEQPDGLTFQYKEHSAADWTEMDPSDMEVDPATRRYTAILTGLKPSSEYVFRSVSAEDKETKEIMFSTSAAQIVPNLSFDSWYMDGSAWIPNASSSSYVWDSANPGTASLGTVPTTPEESDVVKGKAARLETSKAMGMLAAGNIYVGKFVKVAGLGAELDWGYPFSSRPLALKGYYKYAPKSIDMTKDPYKGLAGQSDQCQIQIFLTDWDGMFRINTSKKQFVDFENDEHIIAHGSLTSANYDNGYVKFTLPLVYRNDRTPKYIVIVAAASRYGDYFTGAVGSVLKVDEFELVYDPSELTEEEFDTVFSKVNPF